MACKRCKFGDEDAPCRCDLEGTECFGVNAGECPDRDRHVDWLWDQPLKPRPGYVSSLLDAFYETDQKEIEKERRALLAYAQELAAGR